MKKWNGYQKGVNLGGWLSQTTLTPDHCNTFIQKSHIENIKSLGFDHLRLPVDFELIQDKNGSFIEEGFTYIQNCIDWCGEFGLNMILDLHKADGFCFDPHQKEQGLFNNEQLKLKFISLWSEFARRYGKYSPRIAFELLNEVVSAEDNEPWMALAERTVREIRRYAPEVKILIGSYMNNSVLTVKHIAQPFDENIVYNFHCYDPLLFTHQGAGWIDGMPKNLKIAYPMGKTEFLKALAECPANICKTEGNIPENGFSAEYFENIFKEAIEVAEERNVMLYCGEYGVIEKANPEYALNWYKDIHSVFDKYGIGRSLWNYKGMDFGIIDGNLKGITDKLL